MKKNKYLWGWRHRRDGIKRKERNRQTSKPNKQNEIKQSNKTTKTATGISIISVAAFLYKPTKLPQKNLTSPNKIHFFTAS